MANSDRFGAAVHEAGHAVVAWALGLVVGELAIGIKGDDTAGTSEIGDSGHLPLVDQIAICLAGLEAQEMFECPPHNLAGMSDLGKIVELIENGRISGDESRRLREAGATRARNLLSVNREQVVRLAEALVQTARIDARGFFA